MAGAKTLAAVWPDAHVKIHLCIEDVKNNLAQWLLKGYADSEEGLSIRDKLAYARVTDVVHAGQTMQYIYISKASADAVAAVRVDNGKQISLF